MIINEKIVQKGLDTAVSVVKKAESKVSQAVEEHSEKLAQELDASAFLGRSQAIVKKKAAETSAKTISESEFFPEVIKKNLHLYDSEKKGLQEIAKIGDDLYDTGIIDLAKEIKAASIKGGEECEEIDKILNFIITKDGIDLKLKNKIIDLLKKDPFSAYSIANLQSYKNCSDETKEAVLDLAIKLSKQFEDKNYKCNFTLLDDINGLIHKYIPETLPKEQQLSRIEKLSKVSEDVENIYPLTDLFGRRFYHMPADEALQAAVDFMETNIIPDGAIVDKFFENPEEFKKIINFFGSKKFNSIRIDNYTAESILESKNSKIFDEIKKIIEGTNDSKKTDIAIKESTLNLSELNCSIGEKGSLNFKKIIFDKSSGQQLYTEKVHLKDNKIFIKNEDPKRNCLTKLKYNQEPFRLDEEIVIYKDKNGKEIYRELLKESAIQGQYDMYRISPNGKIEVLAKSFKDPLTGETVIKRQLESPNGTKTFYNYKGTKKGNYTFDYVIKNKQGETLMENHQKYTILNPEHFISEFNGKKYDIVFKNNILTVTQEGVEPVFIDMKKFVPDQNQEIIDTIIHLPGHELVNLKKSDIKKVMNNFEDGNAGYIREGLFDRGFEKDIPAYIDLGKGSENSRFIFLHEFGHEKDRIITDADYDKLMEIYKKELAAFIQNSTQAQQRHVDYLIDTDHYLNAERGAIGEVVPDVNAHLSVPADDADLGIRAVKFPQNFPETIAFIAKILNK